MTKQTALTHFLFIWLILISVLVPSAEILFVSDRDWNSEIYIMDEAGNNPRNLTNGPKGDSSPSWSPDKQQIVFARSSRAQDGILDKKAVAASDIYLISASGKNLRQLINLRLISCSFMVTRR